MAPTLLDLKGMNGTAPTDSIALRFFLDKYALSALISLTSKFWAVFSVSSGSSGQSPSLDTLAVVTTFVAVPTMTCSLTHLCLALSLPCFWSNQRSYVTVEKPVESWANCPAVFSISASGAALSSTSRSKMSVVLGSSKVRKMLL